MAKVGRDAPHGALRRFAAAFVTETGMDVHYSFLSLLSLLFQIDLIIGQFDVLLITLRLVGHGELKEFTMTLLRHTNWSSLTATSTFVVRGLLQLLIRSLQGVMGFEVVGVLLSFIFQNELLPVVVFAHINVAELRSLLGDTFVDLVLLHANLAIFVDHAVVTHV